MLSDKEHRDLLGFIAFCITHSASSDSYCLQNIVHDLVGLAVREEGFSPRTNGYAKYYEGRFIERKEKASEDNLNAD
jgi:hypothetical protein